MTKHKCNYGPTDDTRRENPTKMCGDHLHPYIRSASGYTERKFMCGCGKTKWVKEREE